jgi:hypothetical protein
MRENARLMPCCEKRLALVDSCDLTCQLQYLDNILYFTALGILELFTYDARRWPLIDRNSTGDDRSLM